MDRFDNNKANIPPYDPSIAVKGRDTSEGRKFQGGKLKGITRRLDYIKNLGCTAIWLSPIFKNRQEKKDSYHGYGIQNFLEVDPRFGTETDLIELVKEAHSRQMYVILDIIFNHTGDNWAYPGDYRYYYWKEAKDPFDFGFWRETDPAKGFQEQDAIWPSEFQDLDYYKRRGEIRDWNDYAEFTNGDFFGLKELDIVRPKVLDSLIKSYKYWISIADIDGFRVDTVKHMESTSVAIFCNAIREYAKRIGKHNFFMFGEVVDSDDVIHQYIGRNSRIEGTNERFPSLDSCLDFPLYFILEEIIKGFSNPSLLRERYERFKNNYTDHGEAGRYFVTFVDNHDQMSRPYRRFMHKNPFPKQAVLAIGYLLTSQGIPCIYYGTEQGFDGGGDNDCYVRECMFGGKWGAFDTTGVHFFNEQHEIYQGVKSIAEIRASEPALRYGRQYFREISRDGKWFGYPTNSDYIIAFSRILDTCEIIVAMNLSASDRNNFYITVDGTLSPSKEGKNKMINMLDGRSVDIKEKSGRTFIYLPLKGHEMAICKLKE